jgi:hypothetical protein
MKLNLPRRTKKRVPTRERQPLLAPATTNQIWALDFMHDTLYDGRRYRTLNVIDEGNRDGLTIECGASIPSARLIRVMARLIDFYGKPEAIRSGQWPRTHGGCLRGLVRDMIDRHSLHPARQARSEHLHRTFQPYLPHRSAQRLPVQLG